MMFTVTRDAMITLDGRKADLDDLKPGFTARVQASGLGTGGSTTSGTGTSGRDKGTTDKDSRDKGTSGTGTSGTGTSGRDKDSGVGREGGTTGRMMSAVRIEAFSRSGDKGGRDTGRTGGTEKP